MKKLKNKNYKLKIILGCALILIAAGGLFFLKSHRTSDSKNDPSKDKAAAAALGSAADIHKNCESKSGLSDEFDCYEQTFTTYMKANGGKATLTLLDDMQKMGGYAQTNCHPLAHKVGNIAFHQYGSVLAAVPEYLPVCSSGYYHGLLEEYLATAPDYYVGIKTVCGTTTGGPEYFNWFQCTHGLGHGVMQYRQDEVPQSLKDCDQISPDHQGPEICYAGVFMENITTDAKTGHLSKYVKPEDPIYPCDIVDTKYKSACYFLSSSQILKLNGWNFQDGFNTCDKKAEKDYIWLCYESMGRDVSGSSQMNNAQVKNLCLMGAPDMRGECFFGAVRDYINYQGKFDTAIGLCDFIPGEYQEKCFSGIFLDLGLYKKGQDFLNVCATMPEHFKTECDQRVVM